MFGRVGESEREGGEGRGGRGVCRLEGEGWGPTVVVH